MPKDYIFVSYSHKDEEWLDLLRIFLKPFPWGQSYKAGGRVWADPYIQTGERWRREIGDGLTRARVAVLLVSQDFLGSDFIASDELPALLQGARASDLVIVCVPVRTSVVDLSHPELLEYQWPRPYDQPLDGLEPPAREAALAQIFRKLYDVAKAAGLTEAAPTARIAGVQPTGEAHPPARPSPRAMRGRLFGVPAQRPNHIPRIDVRHRIRTALLTGPTRAVGLTGVSVPGGSVRVGVYGQGGLGKTVSAIDVVHDEDVCRAFPDGIYWLTLGQTPDLTSLQATLIQQVTDAPAVVTSVPAGSGQLRDLLTNRACLIVLDDVWRYEDARAFDVLGEHCRLFTTTRDASVLTALGAADIQLKELSERQALELLALWTNQPVAALPPEANLLVKRCGYLPLAISVAGAMVRDGTDWSDILAALEAGNLRFLDHPYASVFASLRLSVDALPASTSARYLELAVTPEDVPLPVQVVTRLWAHTGGIQEYESRRLLADLDRKGLLYLEGDGDDAHVRFHDLQRDFLQLAVDNARRLHGQLLDAFAQSLHPATAGSHRAWSTLPDDEPYLWLHLTHHLLKADLRDELRALLQDYDWIAAKLRVTDINAVLADYEPLAGDPVANLVRGALRLSAHVLAQDRTQLAGQMIGRLLQVVEPEIQRLLATAEARNRDAAWLHPVTPSLTPPGGPLIRTLVGHTAAVTGVAVTTDGRRAVSSSSDRTLKVWDLATGAVLHTLEGHTDGVEGIAVTSDGRRAVSVSWDSTLKVWDLDTGAVLNTLEGYSHYVEDIAVTPDGRQAVSATYDDNTLRVWDLGTGAVLQTLKGHTDVVHGITVTPDGRGALSASSDQTVKIWDLNTGALLYTLEGHTDAVLSIAVTADGHRAVSGSGDGTLKIWDLGSRTVLRTLEGHQNWISSVLVAPDGRHLVSASADHTLKIWDLTTGAVLQTLVGHPTVVTDVALTPDGRHAISASYDHTLKLWDLTTDVVAHTLQYHTDMIHGVAVTADGRRAVSASADHSLKLWDLATGAVIHTLPSQVASVTVVAVTPDGCRAVSASDDQTVKVWDQVTGALLHTLQGHTDRVTNLEVTPDGRRAVSASWDLTLKVWDLATGALLHSLSGHLKGVNGIAVTPDSSRAVSAARDGTLKVWNLVTGALIQTLEGHTAIVSGVAVTPDGRRALSTAFDQTLKIWDLTTGAVLHTLKGHRDTVTRVTVTPDGRHAVSASRDSTLRVWDLTTATTVATFSPDGYVFSCAVAPDGGTLVAGDALGRVHFLRLENG